MCSLFVIRFFVQLLLCSRVWSAAVQCSWCEGCTSTNYGFVIPYFLVTKYSQIAG